MQPQTMRPYIRILLIILAIGGLTLTIVPSFLNWQGITGPRQVNSMMVAGTVLWFGAATLLFVKKEKTGDRTPDK